MSPTFTSCPTLTGTDCTLRESALLTSYVSAASILPSPRTWVVMVPGCTDWPVTSGRERFMIVFEKKVSTSMTAKKMMATFLTQPLFLTFSLMAFPPSECVSSALDGALGGDALDEVFLAVQEEQQRRHHVYGGDGEGQPHFAGVYR